MKFIAKNSFANPPGFPIVLEDIKDEKGNVSKQEHVKDADGNPLKHHVHKGAQFSIGSADKFEDLSPSDQKLVAQLKVSGKITDATPDAVKKVASEVNAERLRKAKDAEKASKSDTFKLLAGAIENLPKALADALASALGSVLGGKKA